MDLNQEEIDVLKKINSIKYSERTKQKVVGALEGVKPEIFTKLLTEKILFEYKKNGTELMGIDKNCFPLLNEGLSSKLFNRGFLIVEDKGDMYRLSNDLTEKQAQVKGVKSFDGKLYVITFEKYKETLPKLEGKLETEKKINELCSEVNLEKDLCRTILEIMKESGEVIEKRKDVFVKV